MEIDTGIHSDLANRDNYAHYAQLVLDKYQEPKYKKSIEGKDFYYHGVFAVQDSYKLLQVFYELFGHLGTYLNFSGSCLNPKHSELPHYLYRVTTHTEFEHHLLTFASDKENPFYIERAIEAYNAYSWMWEDGVPDERRFYF